MNWEAGDVRRTFPWQVMADREHSLGFYISAVKERGTELWLRSDTCEAIIAVNESACPPCVRVPLSKEFRTLEDRALKGWVPHMPYGLLNQEQYTEALTLKSAELSEQRARV